MIPMFARIIHALFYDEAAFRRWVFGLFGFLASLAPAVFIEGVEVAFTWTRRQWAVHLATSFVAWAVAMVNPAAKTALAAPGPSLGFVRVRMLVTLALIAAASLLAGWTLAL